MISIDASFRNKAVNTGFQDTVKMSKKASDPVLVSYVFQIFILFLPVIYLMHKIYIETMQIYVK